MSTLLHIQASPRERSYSTKVANAFKSSYLEAHPDSKIDLFDIFAEDLPSFDGYALDAKYAILNSGKPDSEQLEAWGVIEGVIDRVKSADAYLFSVPMWNFGIPYRLKQLFDIIIQPGYTFTVSPEEGYSGLLAGKKTVAIYARGGEYIEGTPGEAMDFQKKYLDTILGFIGLTDVVSIIAEPTLASGPDAAQDALKRAIATAQAVDAL